MELRETEPDDPAQSQPNLLFPVQHSQQTPQIAALLQLRIAPGNPDVPLTYVFAPSQKHGWPVAKGILVGKEAGDADPDPQAGEPGLLRQLLLIRRENLIDIGVDVTRELHLTAQ